MWESSRASEMVLPGVHGWTSCSWRTVAYDYARLRVRGGGWGGGFVGVVTSRAVLGSCIALRASAVAASLRWVWRVRADEASVMCVRWRTRVAVATGLDSV